MGRYMDAIESLEFTKSEYFWTVYFPIAIWLLMVLAFLLLLFKRYTFGNWTEENPNPHAGETFDMPRGTFRGILTMTLLYVAVVLELVNVRIVGFEQEIQYFMEAFQMMIAFYFGSKVMHHMTSTDRKKAEFMSGSETKTEVLEEDFDESGAAG